MAHLYHRNNNLQDMQRNLIAELHHETLSSSQLNNQ